MGDKVTMPFKERCKIAIERLKKEESFISFFAWLFLRIQRNLHLQFTPSAQGTSKREVDVVIVTASKDYEILESVISSLKEVSQPIHKIFIVSKAGKEIEEFSAKHACVFIDEISVLGYGREKIPYSVQGDDRSGWLFQQLLKMAARNFVEKENYIVIDSDTVLIRPHSFIENDKYVFFEDADPHKPYAESFQYLLGYPPTHPLSYVTHMMIFNTEKMRLLQEEITSHTRKPWDQAIISTHELYTEEKSCFSEYETYANWFIMQYPHLAKVKPFYNIGISRKEFTNIADIKKRFSDRFSSVSFHSHLI